MPQDRIRRRKVRHTTLIRAARGAALAALVVCANSPAAWAGDNNSFYDKFLRVLGLKNPLTMEYGIDYSERSPLVVPPTRDLPPPVATAPPPTPDWPKDPDIKQRAQAKAEQKVVPGNDYVVESSRPLRPDELNAPGGARPSNTSAAPANASSQQDDRYPNSTAKKSIFSFDWFKKEEYATFTGEPARTSLTDPPAGYLTPSPDQPYGISPEKKPYKIPTVADRMEPTR
jgi:hypothetical protein